MSVSIHHRRLSLDLPITGVAIAVSTLRSELSCGIGEFLDLPLIGRWCVESGLSLIQILPVNDTGRLSSPYSAVSAFALNPAYIRLQEVPGTEKLAAEIEDFRQTAEARDRLDFEDVLDFKLGILFRAYEASLDADLNRELDVWIEANDWVRPFAVYKCLKDRYELKSWVDWPEYRDPSPADIDRLWTELKPFVRFYAWIQMHLDRQFRRATTQLHETGVFLKGDIPILMNVDSADVWAYRSFFNLDFGAGAPPDMFTRIGQTWGFPIYRWDEIESDNYSWWIDRLNLAAKYYDAFRIDHVIGFFRIWSQAAHERTAILGHYEPSPPITVKMMEDAGFTEGDIRLLIEAWATEDMAQQALASAADRVLEDYFHPGNLTKGVSESLGSLFLLNNELASEFSIDDLDEEEQVRSFLTECHRDRSLVQNGPESYCPAWYWEESKGVTGLKKKKKAEFRKLVDDYERRARPIWMALGRKTLSVLNDATDMLACAEDLGAVPEGLREVLEDLQILSLKIERWEVDEDGGFIQPSEFPHLSVTTPSVHDLATLRVWWEESDEHLAYFTELGLPGECPDYLTIEVAEASIKRNLLSSSAIVVFQIQDLFSLTYDLRIDPPTAERFNVPGTVGDHNWSYRMPVTIGQLRSHEIGATIRRLVAADRGFGPKPTRE